jgi:thiamine biosynthesis lipoprotein
VVSGSGRLAIATSATYERGAHIIDPSTRQPTAGLASVTIVGPDLTYADAYATAVFVMGVDGLDWLIRRHPDYAGFVITHHDTAVSTPNFAQHRIS